MSPAPKFAEESVSLRFYTSALAIVGILAACQLAGSSPGLTLFGIVGTVIGSIVSYKRRQANNFWIKWGIAIGILIVQGLFIEEIIYRVQASIADARAPLTNMLIALQALHSFDLPRRRDLNVSALVGLTLLASAATLSRDLTFGPYLLAFLCFGAHMLYLDCISRTAEGATEIGPAAEQTAASRKPALLVVTLLPLMAIVVFFCLPKIDIALLHNVRVSLKINFPFLSSSRVSNPMLSHARLGDGSLVINPLAYFGFNEQLDLNYRGKLSDQVVMKVASSRGSFWRAMAFDTYDGHTWSMRQPDKTFDRLAMYGSAIPLAPVPSLTVPARIPVVELSQVFQMEVDQPNLIPAAAVPHLIYFPANKVQVDTYGALRSPVLMEKDMVYTVFSQIPQYDLSRLRQAPDVGSKTLGQASRSLSNYLQLPPNLPQPVRNLALQVSGQTGNLFSRAERIDNFLKTKYRYNLDIPATPPNKDVVADFLFERKSGYCEHFASTFVVMCRSQGIPARLVTGFIAGEYNPFTGLWEVRMRDAHAWAEIFGPRWGWIPFDPTPDGAPPGFQNLSERSPLSYIGEQIRKALNELLKNPAVQAAWAELSLWLVPLANGLNWLFFFVVALWQPVSAVMSLIVVCALILLKLRARKRRSESATQRLEDTGHQATAELLKVCQALKPLEVERCAQETTDEFTAKLTRKVEEHGDLSPELPELVQDFMSKYAAARFGLQGETRDLATISGRIHERVSAHLLAKDKDNMHSIFAERD